MPRREHLDGRFLELDLGLFAQAREFPFKMAEAMNFAEAGAPGRELSGAIFEENLAQARVSPIFQ